MTKKVYVGNLAYQITNEELKDFFSKVAEVVSANVIIDKITGRSRGFGFVEIEEKDFEEVLKLDGKEFAGRNLNVREAQPLKERSNQGNYRN
jgi:RNA recognition motif-containing protein